MLVKDLIAELGKLDPELNINAPLYVDSYGCTQYFRLHPINPFGVAVVLSGYLGYEGREKALLLDMDDTQRGRVLGSQE